MMGYSFKTSDVIAPKPPTVNRVEDNDTVVTGKTVAKASVFVTGSDKQLGKATAASNGTFTVKIAKQKAGTSYL
ncbi:Ig-like domain-containing protein [Fictibacillus terranigra]|uniref:Ig-like domain-containing protein n=1 Tax=Fictibacillus terranigra TaxID=3058424 RepID=A0ABT8E512_9BACL|nr:Ig-like domain-containing protein [Fictibacillus sp. CENA-BCM004]MDN4072976.1 Ig-like domain-containing protein [Fictibacillus sp. CENA-BCM004]